MREPVFNETVQLGIVVRDLEATVRRSVDDYGIGPWEFAPIDAGDANNYREYGRPVERSTRIAVATVGRVMWEIIEPLDEEGIYARFLSEKSEGVHPSAGNGGFSEVWPGGAQRSSRSTCRTDRAELYPPRSTLRWMPLLPSRNTIEGTLIEGGSKWARLCGTDRATTDEIGAARSDRTTTNPTRNQREGNPL